MVRDVLFDVVVDLFQRPTPEAALHFTRDLRVHFVVNVGLQGVDLTADFRGFGFAADLRLVFVGKFVVDAIVKVQIVELFILSIDFPNLLSELNCSSIE